MSAAMQGLGSVLGLVVAARADGDLAAGLSDQPPIGALIIWIGLTWLEETRHERLSMDITGALLATLGCGAAVMVFTQGPPRGWDDPWVFSAGVAAVLFGLAFLFVERRADHPLVPCSDVFPRPQPGGHVHLAVPGRRGDAVADRDDRAVRAGRARLLGPACRNRLHPVRGGAGLRGLLTARLAPSTSHRAG